MWSRKSQPTLPCKLQQRQDIPPFFSQKGLLGAHLTVVFQICNDTDPPTISILNGLITHILPQVYLIPSLHYQLGNQWTQISISTLVHASAHMTNDLDIILNLNSIKIIVGKNQLLPINVVDTSFLHTLNDSLRLSLVYHIPALSRNLLSVIILCKDNVYVCVIYLDVD